MSNPNKINFILDEIVKYSKQDGKNINSNSTKDALIKEVSKSIESIIDRWKNEQSTKLSFLIDGKAKC